MMLVGAILGCVPLQGGWDVDALIETQTSIAALEGQRLGDMLPFPALDGDRIVFVACRFGAEESVRVHGSGSGWPAFWGEAAVRALDQSVDGVELVLENEAGRDRSRAAEIEIVIVEVVGGEGPRGLGDTLCECDVSVTDGTPRAYRGRLTGAEIRMRRAQLDSAGRFREASAEEWIGALMHELAHALGFAGHAAAGHSILVRDEALLRAAGRRARVGRALPDATLEALYRLRPGQSLGERRVKSEGLPWLRAIRQLDGQRTGPGRARIGTFSSVGDQQASIVWRYSDGSQLGVWFPFWRSELQSGAAITLRPDRTTRQWIAMAAREKE